MTWLESPGGVAAALNRYDRLYAGLTTDEVWPRDEAHRYRLYLRDPDLRVIAAGPSGASIGDALVRLAADGEWDDTARIGILDTHADPEVPGTWIANPFA